MTIIKDISGQRFGRLLAIRKCGRNSSSEILWLCRCDCGREYIVSGTHLRRGVTRSCGCLKIEMLKERFITHGQSHLRNGKPTRTYEAWSSMKSRCFNPKKRHYEYYGARGITVCERWLKFENFLADMGECPPKLSIHRINNDGNYEPSNCKWATLKEQGRAKSNNRLLTINGETKPLIAWAEQYNILKTTLRERLQRGWSAERAVGL